MLHKFRYSTKQLSQRLPLNRPLTASTIWGVSANILYFDWSLQNFLKTKNYLFFGSGISMVAWETGPRYKWLIDGYQWYPWNPRISIAGSWKKSSKWSAKSCKAKCKHYKDVRNMGLKSLLFSYSQPNGFAQRTMAVIRFASVNRLFLGESECHTLWYSYNNLMNEILQFQRQISQKIYYYIVNEHKYINTRRSKIASYYPDNYPCRYICYLPA